MEALKKAIVVLVVLGVGLGAALMFRKQPEVKDETATAQKEEEKTANGPSFIRPSADGEQGVPLPSDAASPTTDKPTIGSMGLGPRYSSSPPAQTAPVVDAIREDAKTLAAGQIPPLPPQLETPERPPLPELSNFDDRPTNNVLADSSRRRPPPLPMVPLRNVDPSTTAAKPAFEPQTDVPRPAKFHTIVNGDSLARLAQRYLGDVSRASEIFDANRDVLANPEVLPLGVRLKMPARHNSSGSQVGLYRYPANKQIAPPPLVPVSRGF